jgi:hypothetical protein
MLTGRLCQGLTDIPCRQRVEIRMAYPGAHTEAPAMPPAHGHIVAIPRLNIVPGRQLRRVTGDQIPGLPTRQDIDRWRYGMRTGFCQMFWGFVEGRPRELGHPIVMNVLDSVSDFNSIKTGTDEYVRENPGCGRDQRVPVGKVMRPLYRARIMERLAAVFNFKNTRFMLNDSGAESMEADGYFRVLENGCVCSHRADMPL